MQEYKVINELTKQIGFGHNAIAAMRHCVGPEEFVRLTSSAGPMMFHEQYLSRILPDGQPYEVGAVYTSEDRKTLMFSMYRATSSLILNQLPLKDEHTKTVTAKERTKPDRKDKGARRG